MNAWWGGDAAFRLARDFVAAELRRLRPDTRIDWTAWAAATPLDDAPGGLDCDSLELMQIATAFSQAFGLDRAGIDDYLLARRKLGDWAALLAQAREMDDATLVFYSSGSTGAPTPVRHRLSALDDELEAVGTEIGSPRRILAAVPAHHIYGFLFTVLLPAQLAIINVDIRSSPPSALTREMKAGDWVIGHPAFWESVAGLDLEPQGEALALCSTGPISGATRGRLQAAGWRGVEIYGSTETAGIGLRPFGAKTYALLAVWRRTAQDRLERLAGGDIVEPPDALHWLGEREFELLGRKDEAVQVAGHNVYPDKVADVLRAHPQVAEAAVRPTRGGDGTRLKAFIVPATSPDEADDLRPALERWIAERLPPLERPRSLRFGASLPCTETGKLADWLET